MENLENKTIRELAQIIQNDWKSVNNEASHYLGAMFQMTSIKDRVGMDIGYGIVGYFLANCHGWKGDTAQLVKAELTKRMQTP
jgi:hypothetical protein